jgi:hypothetical protein
LLWITAQRTSHSDPRPVDEYGRKQTHRKQCSRVWKSIWDVSRLCKIEHHTLDYLVNIRMGCYLSPWLFQLRTVGPLQLTSLRIYILGSEKSVRDVFERAEPANQNPTYSFSINSIVSHQSMVMTVRASPIIDAALLRPGFGYITAM